MRDSQGTYTYQKAEDEDNIGEIILTDGTLGIKIQITLTYTDEGQGTFSASVITPGVPGDQAGTFTEEE